MKRLGIAALGFALVVGIVASACGSEEEQVLPATPTTDEAQVDLGQLFRQGTDALNSGDVDAVMELYADDAVFTTPPVCDPVPCVGKDAIRNVMEYFVAENFHQTVASVEVSQDTVTAKVTVESDDIRALGATAALASHSVEFRGRKVSKQVVTVELTGPGASGYIGGSIDVELGPGRDADQSPGTATLVWFGERTNVVVTIPPGPAGVSQPASIHEGTCADLGTVAFPLQDVGGGKSGTGFGFPLSDLQTGKFAIAIQKSHDEPDVFVACGDIPAAED